jgi:hypothetical protein
MLTPGETPQESPDADLRRLFLYGSCVTRDTAEYLPAHRYALLQYVARQSLISAYAPASAALDLTGIESGFQRRMLEGDARGNLPGLLEEASQAIDLLVWDLADERLGVLRSPEGGVVTRSVEAISAGVLSQLPEWELLEFGSDQHFSLWSDALDRFTGLLKRLDLLRRTVILEVPWAETSDDGSVVPTSFGLSSSMANDRYERYYARARASGVPIEQVQRGGVIASATHRWGLAPFHYAHSTYQEIVRRIETRLVRAASSDQAP